MLRRAASILRPRKSGWVNANAIVEVYCGLRIEIGLSVVTRELLNEPVKTVPYLGANACRAALPSSVP